MWAATVAAEAGQLRSYSRAELAETAAPRGTPHGGRRKAELAARLLLHEKQKKKIADDNRLVEGEIRLEFTSLKLYKSGLARLAVDLILRVGHAHERTHEICEFGKGVRHICTVECDRKYVHA